MRQLTAAQIIERVLDQCAAARPGETALIVTDFDADQGIVQAFAGALRARGLETTLVACAPAAIPGAQPPASVALAMLGADLILELTSVFIGSAPARVEACKQGARYLTMPGLTWHTLRPGGPFAVDFAAAREPAERLGRRIDAADTYRLVTDAGTDLTGSFAGRRGRPLYGVAATPGAYMAPPDIEVGAAPVEGTSEGVIVIDGPMLFLSDGPPRHPVRVRVQEGRAVAIEGPDAHYLLDALDRCADPRMDVIAEVSVGINPYARPAGSPLELEGALGCAHFALGNNAAYGGSNPAVSHLDSILYNATLYLDGVRVIDHGRILEDEA